MRAAPDTQQRELYSMVAEQVCNQLHEQPGAPLWLNTDGGGVPWLHVRLDSTPKYIKHRAYTQCPGGRSRSNRF